MEEEEVHQMEPNSKCLDQERSLVARTRTKETRYSYLVLAISFLSNVILDGMQASYGLILQDLKSYFSADASSVTWPVAIQVFIMHFAALMTSAFLDVFGLRPAGVIGGLLSTAGLVMASFAPNVAVFTVGYGFFTGIGFAFLYLLSSVSVQKYFTRNRAVASGLCMSGSSLGVFAMAPFVRYLLDKYSWRGCMLIQAGITLQCVWLWLMVHPSRDDSQTVQWKQNEEIPRNVLKDNVNQQLLITGNTNTKPMVQISQKLLTTLKFTIDFRLLKELKFSIYLLALFLTQLGFPIMYVFAPDKGSDMGFTKGKTKWFVSCIGIGSLIGRITTGFIGNVTLLQGRRLRLHQFTVALAGVGLILVPVCSSLWSMYAILAIIGFATGGHIVVLPVALVDLFGHDVITRSFGLSLVSVGLASMVAAPLAGCVRDSLGSYDPVFYLAGGYFLLSLLVMLLIPAIRRKGNQKTVAVDQN